MVGRTTTLTACCYGLILCMPVMAAAPRSWEELAPPERNGLWVRPAARLPAQPVWGHADGLRVGLAPMPGPRGLLRIYAPHLGHPPGRMINFIAVEPIVTGQQRRGFSELEPSQLDGVRGKRFWSVDNLEDRSPRSSDHPARGVVSRKGDAETLEVFILVERFNSGAHPYFRLCFQSDRPYEVGLAPCAHPDSQPMHACVLTATMGNYARLRRLHLADRVVRSTDLWPQFDGDGFAPPKRFGLDQLERTAQGHAIVAATTDEREPHKAQYAPFTYKGWKYSGRRAVQYWRCESPPADLYVRVNGRTRYWASKSPIPGGISFENFEMVMPLRGGQELWFGVTPQDEQPPKSTSSRMESRSWGIISPEERCPVECRTVEPVRPMIWPIPSKLMLPTRRAELPQLRLSIWQAAWLRQLSPSGCRPSAALSVLRFPRSLN